MSRRLLLVTLPALWVVAETAERTPFGYEPLAVFASSEAAQQLAALDFDYYRAYVEPLFLKTREQGEGAAEPVNDNGTLYGIN